MIDGIVRAYSALAAGRAVRRHDGHGTELVGRVLGQDDLLDPLLVGRVDHRVDQTDHEGLGAFVDQAVDLPAHVGLVDLEHDLALVVDKIPRCPRCGGPAPACRDGLPPADRPFPASVRPSP